MKLNSSKCCTNTRRQDDDKNRMTTKTATTMITKQGQCDHHLCLSLVHTVHGHGVEPQQGVQLGSVAGEVKLFITDCCACPLPIAQFTVYICSLPRIPQIIPNIQHTLHPPPIPVNTALHPTYPVSSVELSARSLEREPSSWMALVLLPITSLVVAEYSRAVSRAWSGAVG